MKAGAAMTPAPKSSCAPAMRRTMGVPMTARSEPWALKPWPDSTPGTSMRPTARLLMAPMPATTATIGTQPSAVAATVMASRARVPAAKRPGAHVSQQAAAVGRGVDRGPDALL